MLTKQGQSTLEYVIILTAIIAVIIVIAGGVLRTQTNTSLNNTITQMGTQVNKINFTDTGATTP